MGFISKEKIVDYLNAINPCEACSAYGEGAIDVIQHCLTYLDEMPEVDAAKIQKLCNEIEEYISEIDKLSMSYLIDLDCKSIRNRLRAIEKELTGNADDRQAESD